MCVVTSDEADDADVFCLSLRHPLSRCYCDPDIEGAETHSHSPLWTQWTVRQQTNHFVG